MLLIHLKGETLFAVISLILGSADMTLTWAGHTINFEVFTSVMKCHKVIHRV